MEKGEGRLSSEVKHVQRGRKTKSKEATLARCKNLREAEEEQMATRGAEGRGKAKGWQRLGQGDMRTHYVRRDNTIHT